MSGFRNALSNTDYILGFTKITTGLSKGLMYVESPNDIGFWRYLTERVCPGRYEIKPAAKLKSNGKRTLQAEYFKLHDFYIVGVDSDMDYLCQERNFYASELNENKFILHTFSYAKESLQCSLSAIEDIKERLVYDDPVHCEIVEFLLIFSRLIYDALVIHLFLHNYQPAVHNDGLFWRLLKMPANFKPLNQKTLKINNSVIDILNDRINEFVSNYVIASDKSAEFECFVEKLNNKGLTPETSYQFIKGHVLHNNYVYPMLKLYRDNLFNIEREKIGKECQGDDRNGDRAIRTGSLENFYNKTNVLETLLNNSMNYLNDSVFLKMESKLKMLVD